MKVLIQLLVFAFAIKSTSGQVNYLPTNDNVGIGTLTPKKILDVRTGINDFVSIGETIGIGQYSGLHFGYSEYANTFYRKSAIVFERLDNAARGKIHFLNNNSSDLTSATLTDSKMTLDFNGNLAIGTTSPQEKLHIAAASGRLNIRIGRWASVGETYNNLATIIGSNVKASNQSINRMEFIESSSGGGKAIKMQYDEGITFHSFWGSVTGGNEFTGYERMRIDNNGNVGIGTKQITEKLTVNGKIKAKEIQVAMDIPADYVFAPEYNLLPLADVSNFIRQNLHLPNVPSAEELKRNGWNVGEMSNKLLEKVEELTLYILQLEERIRNLENDCGRNNE